MLRIQTYIYGPHHGSLLQAWRVRKIHEYVCRHMYGCVCVGVSRCVHMHPKSSHAHADIVSIPEPTSQNHAEV